MLRGRGRGWDWNESIKTWADCRYNAGMLTAPESPLLVVADNLLARAGLSALLEERGCTVLARVDGRDLQRHIDVYAPAALVVDLGWQPDSMRERLRQIETDLPILALLSEYESDAETEFLNLLLETLLVFPAFALLRRDSEPATIVAALVALASGLTTLEPRLAGWLASPLPSPSTVSLNPLTARENEVLQLLAGGLTNKAIAFELGITQHTVKFHVNAIMGKLGAQSRTQAVVRATQLGLITL